jgi:hypothetical protein
VVASQIMKILLIFLLWCLLLVVAWPLALIAPVLFVLVWLFLLPLRAVKAVIEAVLALFKAILFLPARLLGYKKDKVPAEQ